MHILGNTRSAQVLDAFSLRGMAVYGFRNGCERLGLLLRQTLAERADIVNFDCFWRTAEQSFWKTWLLMSYLSKFIEDVRP